MKRIDLSFALLLMLSTGFAAKLNGKTENQSNDPNFDGPLFLPSGHVRGLAEKGLSVTFENTGINAIYDGNSNLVPIPLAQTDNIASSFGIGLFPGVDFGLDLLYNHNRSDSYASGGFGDSMMSFGFQLLEERHLHFQPNFKISIDQLFPTGRYNNLNSNIFGTDSTGLGSYQTSLELAFDWLTELPNLHYFKTSTSVTLTYAAPARLNGNNSYGGDYLTEGNIYPGNAILVGLAGEYSLDKHWAACLEGRVLTQEASSFSGTIGPDPDSFFAIIQAYQGTYINQLRALKQNRMRPTRHNILGAPNSIGSGNLTEVNIVPSLEYHFSDNLSIDGGVWFTVYGTNTPQFFSSIFIVNLVL